VEILRTKKPSAGRIAESCDEEGVATAAAFAAFFGCHKKK
jgi:hypothetical protein